MNWKKKRYIQCGDSIYNLENWVTIKIINGEIRDGSGMEKCLMVTFPEHENESCNMYANLAFCQKHNMDMLLGLDAGTVEGLFLQAECKE